MDGLPLLLVGAGLAGVGLLTALALSSPDPETEEETAVPPSELPVLQVRRPGNIRTFVRQFRPVAEYSEKLWGVPADLALAQSGLETGWGRSTPGNMMFGMKAGKRWLGDRQLLWTQEVLRTPNAKFPVIKRIVPEGRGRWRYFCKDWFRKYPNVLASFEDHAAHLRRVLPRATWASSRLGDWVDGLVLSGYATDPRYRSSLLSAIRSVQANDLIVSGGMPAAVSSSRVPELLDAIYRNGWTGQQAVVALAIVMAESGGNPFAVDPSGEYYGPWQISKTVHGMSHADMCSIDVSTRFARKLYRARGWQPWGVWRGEGKGRHAKFIPAAVQAIQARASQNQKQPLVQGPIEYRLAA